MTDAEKDIVERLPEIKARAECGIGFPPRGDEDLLAMIDTITTLRAEVERLKITLEETVNADNEMIGHQIRRFEAEKNHADKAEAERDAAKARAEKAEAAIQWALGEVGEFRARETDDPPYWWRPELRRRASLTEGEGE